MATDIDSADFVAQLRSWAHALGFQQLGISDTDLRREAAELEHWLDAGMHGDMRFMAAHGGKRTEPATLVPGTIRVISVRMDYATAALDDAEAVLNDPQLGYVSRYALGRDYHKLMRKRLQKLAQQITDAVGAFGYRVFVDSAPVLEKPLAAHAGLGWQGKHTNLINQDAGSWFFLGELYTDLPLPVDTTADDHCGTCTRCIEVCPTDAIIAPYRLDARRCISYLTIEHKGGIPVEFRAALGNRIYGCDDCQLVCPWNRFATATPEADYLPRNGLESASLLALFAWDEESFLSRSEGSAIRRIGHWRWQRNIIVALGNSRGGDDACQALADRRANVDDVLREHIDWALHRLKPE